MTYIGNSRKAAEKVMSISVAAEFRGLSNATDVQKPNIMLFRSFTNGAMNYDMHFSARFANFALYSAICAEKVKPAKFFMI